MKTVAKYRKGEKTISIIKTVKQGTKRIFFYLMTDAGKRLNATLYARKYDAITYGAIKSF